VKPSQENYTSPIRDLFPRLGETFSSKDHELTILNPIFKPWLSIVFKFLTRK